VEEAPNCIGRAQPPHTLKMGWKKEGSVPRGTRSPLFSWKTRDPYMSRPGAGHVRLTGYNPSVTIPFSHIMYYGK
jgi:hypothetical protein